ncbi:DUF6950 family protein [Aeromonas media]|uniref:DUF6950 family protein n=1 Tax=Aeromonas media TaxID=651 RepID=UPI0029536382|nr:hypothetical protein [Aeromonas media]WOQ15166.1 hypothetical protein R2X36_10115 [Aeromonas media]
MDSLVTINTIEKYINKPHIQGKDDCILLVLDYLEQYDLREQAQGRYTTIRGAKRILPTLTEWKSLESFLEAFCDVVENGIVYDGDIVVHDFHSYIYWQCQIFGIRNGEFKLSPINLPLSDEYKVYRKKAP